MATAIYLPPPPHAEETTKKKQYKILRFDANAEKESESPSSQELHLQEEVRTLREALHEARRQIDHYDTLLRNAQLRERELRAELLKTR